MATASPAVIPLARHISVIMSPPREGAGDAQSHGPLHAVTMTGLSPGGSGDAIVDVRPALLEPRRMKH